MTAPPCLRWSHVGLNCRDMTVTEYFYTHWFGFRRARVVADDGLRVVFLRHDDVYLELFTAEPAEPAEPAELRVPAQPDGPHSAGIARHIAFQVDDLDRFMAAAAGELPISLGPATFDTYIPGWKTVWLRDPDGVIVEVSQGYQDEGHQDEGYQDEN